MSTATDDLGDQPPEWFERLATELAGATESPFRRFPGPPPGGQPRHSAVLALFGTGPDGDELLLTQRSPTMRSHPGQVAFPGGRIDDTDDGPAAAALREAREEAGLDPGGVDLHGIGPRLYLSATDFYVTPVLGWWKHRSPLSLGDPAEVERVALVPLAELTDPENRFTVRHPSGYAGPAFAAGGMLVWGFTAGVINWMLRLAGLEQEWDSSRMRELPDQPVRGQQELARFLQQQAMHSSHGELGMAE